MSSGENAGRRPLLPTEVLSLQSGLSGNNREIRALFAYFSAERAKILCSSDCVAEGEGFEPSVRFFRAKPRRVRKLQIAKHRQRISRQNLTQSFAISPVSVRPPFANLKANARRFCGKNDHVARPPGSLIRFACDCAPSGQSQDQKFLPSSELHPPCLNTQSKISPKGVPRSTTRRRRTGCSMIDSARFVSPACHG